MINYNIASRTYDHSRSHSDRIIQQFAGRIPLTPATAILDFGCGTGNFLDRLQRAHGARCCGVEPSEGMRARAVEKNAALEVRAGDHRSVPFSDDTFDFVYLTDVIHHVPDLAVMFRELWRVLKSGGLLCVVTESHEQIQSRFYNEYFPSMAEKEMRRYPEIQRLVQIALESGFHHEETQVLPAIMPMIVTDQFLKNVAERNYSMFRLLDEREFADGLAKVRKDQGRTFAATGAGDTLIWLRKLPNQSAESAPAFDTY
jgi:ubiquinone/menaquinone biosynthesis C-methylase UbiE